ncbi:hypothetical protein ACQU0X_10500 [Pseudovibrio ascidiaceicola]|uniref:hypothetical protein n=1 Tax=Pseudovibrio ascidiaceicola TaxID=285279 RepID=UPI003D37013B
MKVIFSASYIGKKNIVETIDEFEIGLSVRDRDGETHIKAYVQHLEEHWCGVGVRIVFRGGGSCELQSSFGIDRLGYALETDFGLQCEAVNVIGRLLSNHLPAQNFLSELKNRLDNSLTRIRHRWAHNAANGHRIDRFSIYFFASPRLVLAAPSTAMGRWDILGVKEGKQDRKAFEDFHSLYDDPKKLGPVTQEHLKEISSFSGHEKLNLLSGAKTSGYHAAFNAFEKTRRYKTYGHTVCSGYPAANATAYAARSDGSDWRGGVYFENGDYASVRCGGHYFVLRSRIHEANLNFAIDWSSKLNKFVFFGGSNSNSSQGLSGGFTNKDRFVSLESMHTAFRALLERVIALDPDWPIWLEEMFVGPFDPEHPVLEGLGVPLRHQNMVGTLIDKGYSSLKKKTENFAAKKVKIAAKKQAAIDLPSQIADGAVFGDFNTEGLKFFEQAEIKGNARLFMAQTVSSRSAKRRRRAMIPYMGADNSLPLTPKHVSRMPLYNSPDALLLMPNNMLGVERRDLLEAAFRTYFELPAGAENPFLKGDESILYLDVEGCGDEAIQIRVTRVEKSGGYDFVAFSVVENSHSLRFYGVKRSGAGLSILTTPNGRQSYLRPSYFNGKSDLPPREKAWLEAGIRRAFPLKPSQVDEVLAILEKEWIALSKIYPGCPEEQVLRSVS